MKVCMIGVGYVGLVSGTCFAEMGNSVICVDNNQQRIENLNKGVLPIYEPGLEEMLKSNVRENRLSFTTDLAMAVNETDFCFICVGTPTTEDGGADLSYVFGVAEEIGNCMNSPKIIVDKSTVPVGTGKKVSDIVQAQLDKRGIDCTFDVVSNPEFLKEGMAIEDFMRPDRVVVGVSSKHAEEAMRDLYEPFVRNGHPILLMDVPSAEVTKYAANAMLATRISFMNQVANLCESVGANVESVRKGIGSDSRIGYSFLYAGIGYGGSCFPKDVQAMIKTSVEHKVPCEILTAVEKTNRAQKRRIFEKILREFGEDLSGKHFGLWGLAFKPGTDDIREAPALVLIDDLLKAGAKVSAYDPVATENVQRQLGDLEGVSYADNQYTVLKNADALCLMTEWKQFREPDFAKMSSLMKTHIIFDGRNQYTQRKMKAAGFKYFCIGNAGS